MNYLDRLNNPYAFEGLEDKAPKADEVFFMSQFGFGFQFGVEVPHHVEGWGSQYLTGTEL